MDDSPDTDGESIYSSWLEMLRLANLYQFLPHFYWSTFQMNQSGAVPPLAIEPSSASSAWSEIKDLMVADELIEAIEQMQNESWPIPEVGYELIGASYFGARSQFLPSIRTIREFLYWDA